MMPWYTATMYMVTIQESDAGKPVLQINDESADVDDLHDVAALLRAAYAAGVADASVGVGVTVNTYDGVKPGSCWVDSDSDVGCRWPEPDERGFDSSYAESPLRAHADNRYNVTDVCVLVTGLTADQCAWILQVGTNSAESQRRAKHLTGGGTIADYG